MPELLLTTAFLAGLLGSTHCLGMCGGIAAALGGEGRAAPSWVPLLYNVGRIASYCAAGAAAGAAGAAAGGLLPGAPTGEYLRLAAATVIVLIGVSLAAGSTAGGRWLRAPERWGAAIWRFLSPPLHRRLPRAAIPRTVALGMLWGWLPCGLVYSALLAAAASGSAAHGSATMLAFGLGTLPAMAGIGYLSRHLPRPRGSAARLLGAAIVACGTWTAVLPLAHLSGLATHAQHSHAPAEAAVVAPAGHRQGAGR
ncbi:MAG TPA: sulfite exporter TauE/SafE family protein [Steroidobacteraceae bacterium]|nr:sulfite exporter TauE/SafE family protein [Steroidobacteraceae bacterium]